MLFFWDHQHMHRGLRLDIVEGYNLIVFIDDLGRDLAGDNTFKQRHRLRQKGFGCHRTVRKDFGARGTLRE